MKYVTLLYFGWYIVISLTKEKKTFYPHFSAVIGGGIGGTSVSYFLKKSLPDSSVTLYEPGDIGGRLRTVDIAEMNYECGGSIIHPKNRLMVEMVKEMSLSPVVGSDWTKG